MTSPDDSFYFPRTGIEVRNRSVLAAMTNQQSNPDGTLSEQEIEWLLRRAEGSFGIVTTAASHVVPEGQGWEGEMGVWGDHQLPGLTRLATEIRDRGAVSLAQIFHGGMRCPQRLTGVQPVSSSVNPTSDSDSGETRELTEIEIESLIDSFAAAAVRCEKAGFDGVEIHGAHGYLICQFLGTETNRRKDRWGGSLENRARFLLEIFSRIKDSTNEKFMIGVRISPEYRKLGVIMEDSLSLTSILVEAGFDFIHISCWDCFVPPTHFEDPRPITEIFAEKISRKVPIISAGAIWSTNQALEVIEQGADLVAVARSGIGHANWASNLNDPEYNPQRPPFTEEHLLSQGLSPIFVDYMRNWPGFVE